MALSIPPPMPLPRAPKPAVMPSATAPNQSAISAYWHQVQAQKLAADRAKFIAAAHPAPTAPKPNPITIPSGLNSSYEGEKMTANEAYARGLTQNTFQEGLTRNNFVQQFRDLAQKYAQTRAQEPYSFNGRGMLDSGVYHQGLQDLAQQNLRAYGGLQGQQAQQLGNFQTAQQGLLSQRDAALAAIENQRQTAIANLGMGSIK